VERNARVETFQNRRGWPSRHVVEEEGRHHDPHTTQTPTHAHPLTAPTPSHQVAYFYDSEVGNFYYGQVRRSFHPRATLTRTNTLFYRSLAWCGTRRDLKLGGSLRGVPVRWAMRASHRCVRTAFTIRTPCAFPPRSIHTRRRQQFPSRVPIRVVGLAST
jgi:hypothetical protein